MPINYHRAVRAPPASTSPYLAAEPANAPFCFNASPIKFTTSLGPTDNVDLYKLNGTPDGRILEFR